MRRLLAIVALVLLVLLAACQGPTYRPAYEDFRVVAIAALSAPFIGAINENYHEVYASVYIARECLYGKKLTPQGYRSFVQEVIAPSGGSPGLSNISQIRPDTLERMLAKAQSGDYPKCMEPFMYPASATEIGPAVALVAPPIGLNPFSKWLVERVPPQWFLPSVAGGKPFLVWWNEWWRAAHVP